MLKNTDVENSNRLTPGFQVHLSVPFSRCCRGL